MGSPRNKTIDIDVTEGAEYLDRCLSADSLTGEPDINAIINKTLLGDSFEAMKKLPHGSLDLAIVDPPYNLDKDFHGERFKSSSDHAYAEYTDKWLKLLYPLVKDTGTVYVCCDWRSSPVIYDVLQRYFKIRNRITWQREKGRGAKRNWKNGMEDIWFATVSDSYTFNLEAVKLRRRVIAPYRTDGKPKDWEETENGNFRNTHPSNFWDDISIPYWSMPENTAHPTQKPEKLLAKLILASSNKGDLVFDPFLGSGSTSVTAKKLGRRYLGIEQNEQYCIWAEKRLEMADNDKTIQGYRDGIFWERNSGK
ncbi:MAG: site-specific DNA-methyltransferase [Lachnospiraceae bacterium]|nr:site-specific DNA-methyltransferase [Lachnospiraceae bacterium]